MFSLNKKIRVRFAPSPTGFLHVGSLRTALYNFLLARKYKGKFILRIEDTDIKREIPGAIENLIRTLKTAGLKYDEGIFFDEKKQKIIEKGKYGPYRQSQRLALYQKFAQELIEKDKAYRCFCSKEELEQMRETQVKQGLIPAYDRRCRNLSQEEIKEKLKNKTPYVVRLKVPEQGIIKFKDLIRGEVEFDLKNVDDQVLLKSDGYPTYHLAVVVDDYLMKITHVIRGEEWLPSVPKHILIYQALGWDLPLFAHLPLILNPDRSKLSKRQGDVAVEDYLSQGYLPEALINFIALLGWNPGTDQEIFSLPELIKEFSLERIQKAGAVFNREKLDWMNGYYIRQMPIDELTKRCIAYLIQTNLIKSSISNDKFLISKQFSRSKFLIIQTGEEVDFEWLKKIVTLEQKRMKKLSDLTAVDFFFKDKIEYNRQILIWKKMNLTQVKNNLQLIREKLEKISEDKFTARKIQEILNQLATDGGTGEIFWPLRVALSGRQASPPPAEIAEILGKEKTLKRIKEAIKKI